MSITVQQLSSLIQLVSVQVDPSSHVPESERTEWLTSAVLRNGKKNLILYLCRLAVEADTPRSEVRLALVLLALIVRLTDSLESDSAKSIKSHVIEDLCSIEGFWDQVRAGLGNPQTTVSVRVISLSLLLHAFKLNQSVNREDRWPTLLFSKSILNAVLDLADKQNKQQPAMLCLEYILLYRKNKKMQMALISSNFSVANVLLETCAQVLVSKGRNWHSFDPLVGLLDLNDVSDFANDLMSGQVTFFTPLALMCI